MSAIWITTLWMYALAIAVSLGVAVVIKLIVVALGALERGPAVAVAQVSPPATDAVPAEHVAAIAAAVYSLMGNHRIVHIVNAHDAHRHEGWVSEGRLAHHHSHSPDHHPRK